MGLGSVETKSEVTPPKGHANAQTADFGTVLTRYLGEAKKPKEGPPLEEPKETEQKINWASLAAAFIPMEGQTPLTTEPTESELGEVAPVEAKPLLEIAQMVSAHPPDQPLVETEIGMQVTEPQPVVKEDIPLDVLPKSLDQEVQVRQWTPDQEMPVPTELGDVQVRLEPQPEPEPNQVQPGQAFVVPDEVPSGQSMGVAQTGTSSDWTIPQQSGIAMENPEPWQQNISILRRDNSVPVASSEEGTNAEVVESETPTLAAAPVEETLQAGEQQQTVVKAPGQGVRPDVQIEAPQMYQSEEAGMAANQAEGSQRELDARAPSGHVERQDGMTELDLEIPEMSVHAEAEKHSELDTTEKEFAEKGLPTQKVAGRDRLFQELREATVPVDLPVNEPPVETVEAETQVRKVLDFQDRENLFPKLVESMESLVLGERSEVRIQLKPDHLGEMKIKLSMERGIMVAEFIVQNQAVREVIASQLPQLQTALQDQGTQMADVSVSIGLGNKGQDDEGHSRSKQQQGQNTHGRLQKAGTLSGEKAYLGRSIWNQVDVRV